MPALKKNAHSLATEDNIVATETLISEFYKSSGYPKFTMIHKKGYINAHDDTSMTLDYTMNTLARCIDLAILRLRGLEKTKRGHT